MPFSRHLPEFCPCTMHLPRYFCPKEQILLLIFKSLEGPVYVERVVELWGEWERGVKGLWRLVQGSCTFCRLQHTLAPFVTQHRGSKGSVSTGLYQPIPDSMAQSGSISHWAAAALWPDEGFFLSCLHLPAPPHPTCLLGLCTRIGDHPKGQGLFHSADRGLMEPSTGCY